MMPETKIVFIVISAYIVYRILKFLWPKREKQPKVKLCPTLYKTGGTWGSSLQWLNDETGSVVGWKDDRPEVGDILVAPMKSGKNCVFVFAKVDLCADPRDMFFGTVKPLGYEEEPRIQDVLSNARQPRDLWE